MVEEVWVDKKKIAFILIFNRKVFFHCHTPEMGASNLNKGLCVLELETVEQCHLPLCIR